MTKIYIMNNLIEKMQSPDQDHRFMGLTDLMSEVKQDPSNFNGDEVMEAKVLNQVLKLVEDKISEVKNQAVKCLGALIKVLRESQMETVIDRLIDFSGSKDEELRDIAGLALKTITAELPLDSKLAPNACAKLTPKLLHQLENPSTPPETLIETLAILSILISRFPTYLSSPNLRPNPVTVLRPLLRHARPAVRKRSIITLAQFLPTSQQVIFDELLKATIIPGLSGTSDEERTTVQLIAAIARHSPQKIAPVLQDVVPRILKAASKDDGELREAALQALEALVLKCPNEITPSLSSIIVVGTTLIRYDPNYAGDDDDDDEEMADPDDEDDDAELDEYSDDEDTSYKIRRSAIKLLSSLVETRPELLTSLYKEVSPVLISRFGDREETVKLEVWSTYMALLNQTRVYGGTPQTAAVDSIGGKRKRTEEEGMDVEAEAPLSLLRSQVPALAKALLNQLKSHKTPPNVLQAGFSLLNSLVGVLPGSLSSHVGLIISTSNYVLSQSPTTSNSALHTTCLSFLAIFFSTHSPPTFNASLSSLTPALLGTLGEKHPRIVAESFRVFSALLNALKPVKQCDWADQVYEESVRRLRSADTDAEVRERAEECMGDLWVCATDVAKSKDGKEWDVMCRTTGRMVGAVKVVTRVAREVDVGDLWISGSIDWLSGVLKKPGKVGKGDAFICMEVLLNSYRGDVPLALIPALVPAMKPYLTTQDISLLSHALLILALLLQLSPTNTFPAVENEHLQDLYAIAHSPLISGTALDALLAFFGALVDADGEIATHVIPSLVIALDKKDKSNASYSNVAKCIGQVVRSQQGIAAGTIAEFSKAVKSGSKAKGTQIVLSLLVLGELGRAIDFSPQKELFQIAIDYFGAAEEDIRSAAAFAAGNIAIGNLHLFLPAIVKLVQNEPAKRLLALHAVKEVVSNCPHGQLEGVAETIWVPLFQDSANSEESTRNVAAACLGRLTTTNPARYLPQLQARIRDPDPAARATVVSAIRYTFADTAHAHDELLSGLVIDFLSAMLDEDLTVRRLALSALNSAARNKPQLIRDHLGSLLPSLYKESLINPALIHTVQMGPWTHRVDDGLEARKTAYETMYTLLDTCLSKLDLHEFLGKVMAGLSDDSDEIKVISHMMLFRLAQVAPTAVAQRLEEATPQLEKTMKGPTVTKDTVKQDLERAAELQRSCLRAVAALSKVNSPGVAPRFGAFVEELQRGTWGAEFKELAGA